MARNAFGGSVSDYVVSFYTLGSSKLAAFTAATLTFFDAETGGNQVTDLALNADGSSPVSSIAVPDTGDVPTFYGPDGVTQVWVSANGSASRVKMVSLEAAAAAVTGAQAAASEAAGHATDAASSAAAAEQAAASVPATTDAAMAPVLSDPESASAGVLSAAIELRKPSKLPRIIDAATTAETTATPRALEYFGGYWWGVTTDQKIWRSADGTTWTQVATPGFVPSRLLPTRDGELLAINGPLLYKSSGWSTNPATATWAVVATTTGGVNSFANFGFDSDSTGTRFITVEYGNDRTNANKVWVSLDGGDTFTVAYDTEVEFPATYTDSHLHSCCYDEAEGRFWFSQGHGADPMHGVFYSEDDGATWTRMPSDEWDPDGSPITMVATEHGIVCGSDSGEAALWVIPRADDPTEMRLQILARWRGATNGGAPGGATRSFQDPDDGLVYTIYSDGGEPTYPASIWVTDGITASEFYALADPATAHHVVVKGGVVRASWTDNTTTTDTLLSAQTSGTWQREIVFNDGNIGGGDVGGNQSGVAVGPRSQVTSTHGVAVGTRTSADLEGTAVGSEASAAAGAIAIGRSAVASQNNAIGIGKDVNAGTPYTVVIGYGASSTGTSGVAIGRNASAAGSPAGLALGYGATADWARSVAIGYNASVGAADQIALGNASHQVKISNNATGAGSAALGANCPAITATAPFTWFKMTAGDGSTVFVPAWK